MVFQGLSAARLCRPAVLLALAVLAGCAAVPKDPTAGWSADKLYSEARDELNNNAFDKAIVLFEKLEGRAAGTPLAQQAQLEKAHAYFRNGEQAQAIATLGRFMRLHPASPALDYALYLKGLVSFNDNLGLLGRLGGRDLSEHDQKAAKDSHAAFQDLVTRFPDSKYTPDAKLRMGYIVNSLAQSEVNVARYYFQRGAYVAAVNRAQTAIEEFKDAPALEEALFILYRSYNAMGLTQLRDDTLRVLQLNYPNTEYVSASGAPAVKRPWYRLW